jgi:hypothetical protein
VHDRAEELARRDVGVGEKLRKREMRGWKKYEESRERAV